MLCGACQRIFQGELIVRESHTHHKTRQELQVAAEKESCHICTRLWSEYSRKDAKPRLSGTQEFDWCTQYMLSSSLDLLDFLSNSGGYFNFFLKRVEGTEPEGHEATVSVL
jgi:hypothetical protein